MNSDPEIADQRTNPEGLLDTICEILPGFRDAWEDPDNLFIEDNGILTIPGIFAALSWFTRDHLNEIDEETRLRLFDYVEKCVDGDADSPPGLSNAACTCFLENLAGEDELSDRITPYLGPTSKEFFDRWNN